MISYATNPQGDVTWDPVSPKFAGQQTRISLNLFLELAAHTHTSAEFHRALVMALHFDSNPARAKAKEATA